MIPNASLSHNAKVILFHRMFFISSFVYESKAFGTQRKEKSALTCALCYLSAGKRIRISNHVQVFPEVEIASQFHFRPATKRKSLSDIVEKAFSASVAGSNLPCSNQNINENPEELKDAEIQRFLADLRAISHFCKVFRVGQK